MTMIVVISMYKTSFIFSFMCHVMIMKCHVSLMHTPSSKVLPSNFSLLGNKDKQTSIFVFVSVVTRTVTQLQ